jgi:hypothetical protein
MRDGPGIRAAVVLPALAALVGMLSACSSAAPTANGTPAASGTGGASAAPSLAARLTFSGGQESARIGPYTQVYATPLPGSAAQAKVIRDFRIAQILWGESNEARRPVPPVLAYVTGAARHDLMAALAAGRQRQLVPAGTERFFSTRVAVPSAASATVTTCDDASRYREQNPSTGKVNPAFSPPRHLAYSFEVWHLVPQSGHWAIASFTIAFLPDPRAHPCQP